MNGRRYCCINKFGMDCNFDCRNKCKWCIIGLLLNWNEQKNQNKIRYVELVKLFESDFTNLNIKGINCENWNDFYSWFNDFEYKSETMAHLVISEKIPKVIGEFFVKTLHDAYNSHEFVYRKHPELRQKDPDNYLEKYLKKYPLDKKFLSF